MMREELSIMTTEWHVLGAGAIGGLFAHRLTRAGHTVTLLNRRGFAGERTLTFDYPDTTTTEYLNYEPVEHTGVITHLWVTTKSFDVVPGIKAVLPRLAPDAHVVVLANGMGYHPKVAELLQTQTLIVGSTTAGCNKREDTTWVIAGTGETRLGCWPHPSTAPDWFKDFSDQPWACEWEPAISDALLKKLAVNCAINPPTALWDIANGDLLSAKWLPGFNAALDELAAIFEALDQTMLAREIHDMAHRVAHQTAANTSSMRADLQQGRRTEIEAILGFLLDDLLPTAERSTPLETPILRGWLDSVRTHDLALQSRQTK